MENKNSYSEKSLKPINGWLVVLIQLLIFAGLLASFVLGFIYINQGFGVALVIIAVIFMPVLFFTTKGFKITAPNEAYVLTLFGKYLGSIKSEGFFWVNPFAQSFNPASKSKWTATGTYVPGSSRKISLKAMTLNNEKQKVNDLDGNPIEIGVIVIWRILDTAKAVFNVENYANFVSIQADAAIRNIARQYPYDVATDHDELSLRGSSAEIANTLCLDLQARTEIAGLEIIEARIAHLAYSNEIASAMLQRQQAKAVVDARTTIVEGAVGMVELALEKLAENDIVELDQERKAQMVSNLMVVLCSNKDAQPIVNSSSLY